MKTTHFKKPLPLLPVDPEDFALPKNGHSLKAYFIGQALCGRIACEEGRLFEITKEALVEWAYEVGEMMFQKYAEENLSAICRFNKKVGL